MFHVALYEPEIPPNTGNIIRLCANVGATLHLIEPLGFSFDDRQLKRAGLDYHEYAEVKIHPSLENMLSDASPNRVFALSTHARSSVYDHRFEPGDLFLFGPETRGLPEDIRYRFGQEHLLALPMMPSNRSLNLSNAVTAVIYEAWRQQNFSGARKF